MAVPQDPVELELVRKAITLAHITGCCEWDERAARRLRGQPPVPGMTPEGVKGLLHHFVGVEGGEVRQIPEKRPEYQDRPFYYKVIIPLEGLARGLFVEVVLDDEDPDLPVVRIVNAHEA